MSSPPPTTSSSTPTCPPTWRETFLRPRHGFGTLLQIADTTRDWTTPSTTFTADDVMAGRVVFLDDAPQWRG
jgi:hypothetical protein